MFRPAAVVVACVSICVGIDVRGSEIDAVRESVTTETPESERTQPADPPHREEEERFFSELLNDFFAELFRDSTQDPIDAITLQTLIFPWGIPYLFTEDDYSIRGVVVPEPYHDAPFSLRREGGPQDSLPEVFGRLQVDFSTDFDGLTQTGGHLLLETPWRLGFDTGWSHWWEEQGGMTDTLQLGDANLVFRFAQNDDIQFRSGVGMNWLAGNGDGDVGFNFTWGFDYFPRKPWVFSTNFDVGTLGSASLFHNQTTVGLVIRSCEIFTGYDYRSIGDGELDGWIAGLRWRF